jgi:hypothetical protein
MVRILCLLVLALIATAYGYKRYEGYKVLQVKPENDDQVHALVKMNKVLGFEVDFWRDARKVGRNCDFMVAPEQEKPVLDFLADYGITPKVVVKDMSMLVDRSMKEQAEKPAIDWASVKDDPTTFPLNVYHTHADINTWLQLVATTYSSFVSIASLGKTLEGRDMMFLKIGTPGSNKNALWIDAGIHAREWVADATGLYTIMQLVKGYATTYKTLLDSIDIYVAPSVNPDGYEYSRLHDRNWRKTRSGPRNGCYGVDPNRNWPFKWGYSGVSNNPCSEIYDGTAPMTEKNCQNMKAFLDANKNSIKGVLTLHSYGEDWIYPWGYATHTYPPDVAELRALGLQAAAAIRSVHGTRYVVDNSADSLYPAAGASDDYSKSIGINWVYTVELRPGDGDTDNDHQYGFNLPPQFIIPTAEEAFAGFMVVATRIMTGPN